jgi:hypothetical protein
VEDGGEGAAEGGGRGEGVGADEGVALAGDEEEDAVVRGELERGRDEGRVLGALGAGREGDGSVQGRGR